MQIFSFKSFFIKIIVYIWINVLYMVCLEEKETKVPNTPTHVRVDVGRQLWNSLNSLRAVNLTSQRARRIKPVRLSGSVQSNAALFSLSGGLGLHISVIRLLCSAVLQLCWHLGVAPLFLTVTLPMLLVRWSSAKTEVYVSEKRCFFKIYSRQVEVNCDAMLRSAREIISSRERTKVEHTWSCFVANFWGYSNS